MASASNCDPHVQKLASANFQFGLDLYRKLSSSQGEANLFLSPVSVSTALAMTLLGARGVTADQMRDTLKLWDLGEDVHSSFMNYLQLLQKHPKGILLSSANRLFVSNRSKLLHKYLKDTDSIYGAEAVLSDFAGNAATEMKKINKWVESKTGNRIKDLITNIYPDTTLILVNAIYFKGNWTEKFLPYHTTRDVFIDRPGCEEPVDMMHLQEKFMLIHSDKLRCSILELPYADRTMGMLILLPDDVDGITDLEQNLNKEVFDNIIRQMQRETVLVSLPKFSLESSFNLERVLPTLGMSDVFDRTKSDLSGIDGTRLLYISQVVHKAFLEVNEEGSEAAAATAIVMAPTGMPVQKIQVFKADHPFMFLIRDKRANIDLFMGRFSKP